MQLSRHIRSSLDRRITLLFGGAVLLTIVATLAFPWVMLGTLTDRAMVVRAEQVATLARQLLRPSGGEAAWEEARTRLESNWPDLRRELPSDLVVNMPKLYSTDALTAQRPEQREGFLSEALTKLVASRDPSYWRKQEEGSRLRLAWAVRAAGTGSEEGRLVGLIDVSLPILTPERTWSSLVTVLGGATGAVLAIVVFYIVTQRLVLMPLDRLRKLAERVTAGDLQARADLRTGDEFQELAEAFNEMLNHLSRAQQELERINRSLDIKLGELAETNVALYESNRLKSDFLANVSHELRTPLVSIIGFADLLHDAWSIEDIDRSRLARYTRNILTSGRMLLDLINDLLDLAKIEAGRLEVHLSEFDLTVVCADMMDFIRPIAAKKNQEVRLEIADGLPRVTSDSGKVKQILYNLLSNAVKFTPNDGRIGLLATPDGESHVRLCVEDTGPGIPPEKLHLIFEKFRQLDSSRTREHEGTGLGLAITRELVNILEGTISLDTEVGRGARFTVRIPIRMAVPVAGGDSVHPATFFQSAGAASRAPG